MMASINNIVKDTNSTAESRCHQCSGCSFWFDCLAEPSYANRPNGPPSPTNNEMTHFQNSVKPNSLGNAVKDTGIDQKRWHKCPHCNFWVDCLTEPSFISRTVESGVECPPYMDISPIEIGVDGISPALQESCDININNSLVASDIRLETEVPMEIPTCNSNNSPGNNDPVSNTDILNYVSTKPNISEVSFAVVVKPKILVNLSNTRWKKYSKETNVERLHTATVEERDTTSKSIFPKKRLHVYAPEKYDSPKLAHLCRDYTFDCTDRYFFRGKEVAREEVNNYYRFKECTICGKILVETKLHMFNYHADVRTKEVIFNLTNKRPKPPAPDPNAALPKSVLDSIAKWKSKGVKRVKIGQCEICYKWLPDFGHMGDHLMVHKEELFPTIGKPIEKYFFEGKEISVASSHNYSKWKECSLCGHFVKDISRHVDVDCCGKGYPEVRYNLSAKTCDESVDGSEENFGNIPTKKCKFCGKEVHDIIGHMESMHVKIPCIKCKGTFHQDEIDKHKCSETVRMQCNVCNEWLSKAEFNQHLKKKHLEPKSYSCLQCDAVFNRDRSLKYHAEIHSGLAMACHKCDKVFPGPLHLASHEEFVHSTEGQRFYCDKCDAHYKQKKMLARHVKLEHGDKPKNIETLECHICHKQLQSKNSLRQHVKLVHATSKDFQCEKCPKTFVTKARLKDHLMHAHSDVRSESCDECSKTFKTPTSLKVHKERVHNNDVRSHSCPKCNKAFKMDRDMRKHMLTMHGPQGDPVPCKYLGCSQVFKTKKAMETHLKIIHIETVCRQCDKEFRFVQDYRVHMAEHAGKQIHTCPVCKKLYHQRYLLVNHMGRIHKDFDIKLLPK